MSPPVAFWLINGVALDSANSIMGSGDLLELRINTPDAVFNNAIGIDQFALTIKIVQNSPPDLRAIFKRVGKGIYNPEEILFRGDDIKNYKPVQAAPCIFFTACWMEKRSRKSFLPKGPLFIPIDSPPIKNKEEDEYRTNLTLQVDGIPNTNLTFKFRRVNKNRKFTLFVNWQKTLIYGPPSSSFSNCEYRSSSDSWHFSRRRNRLLVGVTGNDGPRMVCSPFVSQFLAYWFNYNGFFTFLSGNSKDSIQCDFNSTIDVDGTDYLINGYGPFLESLMNGSKSRWKHVELFDYIASDKFAQGSIFVCASESHVWLQVKFGNKFTVPERFIFGGTSDKPCNDGIYRIQANGTGPSSVILRHYPNPKDDLKTGIDKIIAIVRLYRLTDDQIENDTDWYPEAQKVWGTCPKQTMERLKKKKEYKGLSDAVQKKMINKDYWKGKLKDDAVIAEYGDTTLSNISDNLKKALDKMTADPSLKGIDIFNATPLSRVNGVLKKESGRIYQYYQSYDSGYRKQMVDDKTLCLAWEVVGRLSDSTGLLESVTNKNINDIIGRCNGVDLRLHDCCRIDNWPASAAPSLAATSPSASTKPPTASVVENSLDEIVRHLRQLSHSTTVTNTDFSIDTATMALQIEHRYKNTSLSSGMKIARKALEFWKDDNGEIWGEGFWDSDDLILSCPDYAIIPASQYKCNAFVAEILFCSMKIVHKAIPCPDQPGKYFPYRAVDWFDPNKNIEFFQIVSDPQPGDIISTGTHTGVVLLVNQGRLLYISARDVFFSDQEFGVGTLQYKHGIQVKWVPPKIPLRFRRCIS